MAATEKNNLELPGIPRRRGRPTTGQAKSNAERQAEFRARQQIQRGIVRDTAEAVYATASIEEITRTMRTGNEDSKLWAWAEFGRRNGWLK